MEERDEVKTQEKRKKDAWNNNNQIEMASNMPELPCTHARNNIYPENS
jgi:hypothetical protein